MLGAHALTFIGSALLSYSLLVWAEYGSVVEEQQERRLDSLTEVGMPTAWDRRLIQLGANYGEEVALIRRATENGYWLVATPSLAIFKVQISNRRDVRNAGQPRNGVRYRPMEVLAMDQKQRLQAEADRLYAAGTHGVPELRSRDRGSFWRRAVAVTTFLPLHFWKVARWSTKTPFRCVCLLGCIYLTLESLSITGVFAFLHGHVTVLYQWAYALGVMVGETSEWASGWMETLGQWYEWVAKHIDPWKIPTVLLGFVLAYHMAEQVYESTTPLDTPTASGQSTPDSVDTASSQALHQLSASVSTQAEAMVKLMEKLQKLEEDQTTARMKDAERVARSQEVQQARLQSQQEKYELSWRMMQDKVSQFEKILQEDRASATGGPKKAKDPEPEDSGADGSKMAVTEKDAEMAILVKRLQKDAQTPQEIFVEALKQWKEEDKELWATNFPPGYRERTAAHTLGEIYSTGKTGKEWGKEWLKSKGVGDSQEAREILPPLCALDAIFITDRVKDAINQVGVEKLVKKVNGIRAGYAQVQKESDWKKPGGSKSWKSKVDYQDWMRIDPAYEEKDHLFMNRSAEDERRAEMERDAQMLKAKFKLAERQK